MLITAAIFAFVFVTLAVAGVRALDVLAKHEAKEAAAIEAAAKAAAAPKYTGRAFGYRERG